MTQAPSFERTYPWTTTIDGHEVTFRLMTPADHDAVLEFARALPAHDLMFLRTDVTQPQVVDEWVRNLEAGRTITVIGEAEGKVAGYGSLHRNEALWTRHVGEMRVLVGEGFRGLGL
ncbi:MAG TPA: GNAT family N-acetyltransferase, partial [Dehalococcoidia bacterium]|nr:GNAT family N-acetyltransferase [Dehalococcoidia bacterium]